MVRCCLCEGQELPTFALRSIFVSHVFPFSVTTKSRTSIWDQGSGAVAWASTDQ
jgi:hypothetical protein